MNKTSYSFSSKRENLTASNFNPGPGQYSLKDQFLKIKKEDAQNEYDNVYYLREGGNIQRKK